MKGRKLPRETCEKMSDAKKGIRPKNFEEMRKNGGFENFNHKGKNHYNWKGGITPELRRLRATAKYQIWRNAVFLRDDFTCQDCGLRSGNGKAVYLEAHHIKSFALFPELRFRIDNGITYCLGCHIKNDKFRGIKLPNKYT